MKKHVVTGPIRGLSQCHPTITNSCSYSWIWNQMFLLINFQIQELWVIKTTNTWTQPENFQEILQISRRFPGFSGALDTPHDVARHINCVFDGLRPTQPPISQGSVNEYQLRLGRQRQVWFIPLANECGVCR